MRGLVPQHAEGVPYLRGQSTNISGRRGWETRPIEGYGNDIATEVHRPEVQAMPGKCAKQWIWTSLKGATGFRFIGPSRRGDTVTSFFLPRFKLDHCRLWWGRISNRRPVPAEKEENLLLFVRFLYMIRWPHSLHRIGSRGLISFFAPQSVFVVNLATVHERMQCAPAQRYSISSLWPA